MKIFYAVQATGNGHIARAKELIPYLSKYGTVDVFLSGANSSLQPGFDVKYKSKGLCFFYNKNGGIDYAKTFKHFNPLRVWKEARHLPLEKYDIVINDFESITSLSAQFKKTVTIGVGHQVSFLSPRTPRPAKKDIMGEWILKHYATSQFNIGLHFERYDSFIMPPIIKEKIKNAVPKNLGHITVYLPQYGDRILHQQLSQYRDLRFQVFSPFVNRVFEESNIIFCPVSNGSFSKSILNAACVITGAGFETPAEVLYLQKKLICIPIKGQYEQICNAEALRAFGVAVLYDINELAYGNLLRLMDSRRPDKSMEAFDNAALAENIFSLAANSSKDSEQGTTLPLPVLLPH